MGFQAIAEALGLAAVKAAVAISAIIAGGRLVRLMLAFILALCAYLGPLKLVWSGR